MLERIYPRGCSRLSVFISYASEQRRLGEEIAQALKNAGHRVFFDLDSIPASVDYNDRIRSAVQSVDRLVFLASRQSLTPGKFTLTELLFAKERWPSPESRVLPVIVDDAVTPADLPVYLRSVSVLRASGNATAEVVAAIQKTRTIGWLCKAVTFCVAAIFATGLYIGFGPGWAPAGADVVLLPPQKIHFRSVTEAPVKVDAASAASDWTHSRVTVTVMPVTFNHRTEPGRKARILKESLDLSYGGTVVNYRSLYVVEITDALCGEHWYCVKGNVEPQTLEPGRSISRETMFAPMELSKAPTWSAFVDDIFLKPDLKVSVVYRAQIEVPDGTSVKQVDLTSTCRIDISRVRDELLAADFKPNDTSRPVFLEPDCLPMGPTGPLINKK